MAAHPQDVDIGRLFRQGPESAKPNIGMPRRQAAPQLSDGPEPVDEAARSVPPGHFLSASRRRLDGATVREVGSEPATADAAGVCTISDLVVQPRAQEPPPRSSDPAEPKPRAFDSDLSRLVALWHALPARLRQAVLAMVDAAAPS